LMTETKNKETCRRFCELSSLAEKSTQREITTNKRRRK
jgi:hypothetical protein